MLYHADLDYRKIKQQEQFSEYFLSSHFNLRSALLSAIQACEIMAEAHRRSIVYIDHKILHYYWSPQWERLHVIDWNVARFCDPDPNISKEEKVQDIYLFSASMLYYVLVGSLFKLAPKVCGNRADQLNKIIFPKIAEDIYWSEDDKNRIPINLINLVNQCLLRQIESFDKLKEGLSDCLAEIS
jgi:hypothetical protein